MIDLHRLPAATRLELQAYERVLRLGRLTPTVRATIETFHAHEQAHAAALRKLGAAANPPPVHRDLLTATVTTEADCLRLLIAVENVSLGACYDALERLTNHLAVRLTAEMMAADAQHRALLSQLLHPRDLKKVLPDAGVIGVG
jgi:hypothetical protein